MKCRCIKDQKEKKCRCIASLFIFFNFFVFVSHVLETKTLKCLNAHCFSSVPKEHFWRKQSIFLVFPQMWPAGSCQKFSQKQFIIEIVFPGNLQKGKEKGKWNKTSFRMWVYVCGCGEREREIYHLVLVRFRHGCSRNLHIKFLPYLRHITNRLGAERTCIPIQSP